MDSGLKTMTESEREATRRRLQIWQEAQPLLEEQRWGRVDLVVFRDEVEPLLELRGDPEILVRFDRLHEKLRRRLGSH